MIGGRYASGLALLVATLAVASARATVYTYTITGVTTDDVTDIYAYQGATLPLGADFTLVYTVDDASPTAAHAYGNGASSVDGGGAHNDGVLPPVTAALTVGSSTYAVRQGTFFQDFVYDSFGDPNGTRIDEQDRGTASKTLAAGVLSLDARYTHDVSCCGVFPGYFEDSGDEIAIDLHSAGFASGDYRELGSFALTPASTGFFLTSVFYMDHDGSTSVNYTSAGLLATRLTVASDAVPEPGSWALMTAGFAAAGISLRRARPSRPRRAAR